MKTRADLKRELDATVPIGEETTYLAAATSALETARAELQALREQRVNLMRQISVRERKRQDWKGKIVRGPNAPAISDAIAEVARAGCAQCHCIAGISLAKNHGELWLRFRAAFRRALTGVDGFAKLWVIARVAGEAPLAHGLCASIDNGGPDNLSVYLWLVDVVAVDVKSGTVQVAGLSFLGSDADLSQIVVLDVKPYLPYCEAWPDSAS